MKRHGWVKFLKIAVIATAAAALFGLVVMALWNALMPGVFGLHAISFWQAVGILVLSKILFGGFRPRGGGGGPHWRRRMLERWEQMTPEERAKFKEGMRRGCGWKPEREGPGREAEVQA